MMLNKKNGLGEKGTNGQHSINPIGIYAGPQRRTDYLCVPETPT